MIDIHHHLFFGLDDGSPDIETSVAMAEMAAADGITHIVCTPHANSHFNFNPAANQQKLEQLRERYVRGNASISEVVITETERAYRERLPRIVRLSSNSAARPRPHA